MPRSDIFSSFSLEFLETADFSTLDFRRVMARLWSTYDAAIERGREDKAQRAEAIALRLRKHLRERGLNG